MMKRDLKADLELCNKATPGPWYAGATDDEHFMNLHYVTTEPRSYRHDGERAFVEGLIRKDKVVAITLLQTPRFVDCWQFGENTRFIAQAREGWPHAIERAIKAEALVRELVHSLKLIRSSSQFSLAPLPGTTWEEITDLVNIAIICAEEVLGDET